MFYDLIVAPLELELQKAGAQTLMWSLDGTLRYLPMAALYDGKEYLIERYHHVTFTRANRERMTAEVSPIWTGVGFGTSQAHTVKVNGEQLNFGMLHGVSDELSNIFGGPGRRPRAVVSGKLFLDAQFTKPTLMRELEQHPQLVHIASHFSFRAGDEKSSFLLLGDGDPLTLEEMKQTPDLFRGVELLTVSACNTGAQQPGANGREIDGFGELAQRLGAHAVMASLWEVLDSSTSQLMAEFYRQREQAKLTKAESLRQAQLKLLHGNIDQPNKNGCNRRPSDPVENGQPQLKCDPKAPYAHPYFWAPFILIGNWR